MMIKLPKNIKIIIPLSLLCCLLFVAANQYMKSWQAMDVILFMGQSNMSGANGDAALAPKLTDGAGYEYRAITDPNTLHVLEEPFGALEHRQGELDDREILDRNGSLVTAFVNAYYAQTKTPVVAISASRGSSSLNGWLHKGLKEDALARLASAKACLKKEKVHIRHIYMVWFQGEADANLETTAEEYHTGMEELLASMKEQGVEQCFLIQLGPDLKNPEHHQVIMDAQLELCEKSEDVTLASKLPAVLKEAGMKDEGGIHFTQEALNRIGEDAGTNAGAWVQALHTKPQIQDSKEQEGE